MDIKDLTVQSPSTTSASNQDGVAAGHDNKGASLTPPLSSPQMMQDNALSSPPLMSDLVLPSEDQLRRSQPDELRAIITGLVSSLQEARTDAAHHRLQYRMLAMESAEALERIQVEMEMAQRETDVLNVPDSCESRMPSVPQQPDPNMRQVHVDIWQSMVQEMHTLKSQNLQLDELVGQHKKMVVQQESEIASLNDRISLLRDRLRENRQHLTRYRRAAGHLDSPQASSSVQLSPWTPRSRHQPPFAALLHASDLMSERGSLTPKTPRRTRAVSTTPTPITPRTVQPRMSSNVYQTPQTLPSIRHLQVPQTAPPLRGPLFYTDHPKTAPNLGELQYSQNVMPMADDSEAETEVPEDPAELVQDQDDQIPRTPSRTQDRSSTARGALRQGKLFGRVRKAGVLRDEAKATGHDNTVESIETYR